MSMYKAHDRFDILLDLLIYASDMQDVVSKRIKDDCLFFHGFLTSYVKTHDKNVIHVQYEEDDISFIGPSIYAMIM